MISIRLLTWQAGLLPVMCVLTLVSLESIGYRRLFPGPEAEQSSESSAEVKNEWSRTSTPICPRGMQWDCK